MGVTINKLVDIVEEIAHLLPVDVANQVSVVLRLLPMIFSWLMPRAYRSLFPFQEGIWMGFFAASMKG
jgi:hypothetical protein